MEINKIYQGDCLEVLKELPESSVDAIVTDPPYELGFMGKGWDSTGVANNKDMWKECLRVLKPGGHLLSFGGTRTYHRMASAIEDAGFEIRDMIEWIYGSGFPKSLNIGKAVDKLQGNEREDLGLKTSASYPDSDGVAHYKNRKQSEGSQVSTGGMPRLTKGTSEWEGWGTALKPAHEPICMARKPFSGTVAENVLKYGTGGINIDGCRVKSDDWDEKTVMGKYTGNNENNDSVTNNFGVKEIKCTSPESTLLGRFPANLIHDGSEEVRECFPETKTGAVKNTVDNGANQPINLGGGLTKERPSDSGNASRFFKSIIYTAKASKGERNMGLENFEKKKVNDGRNTPIDNAFQRGETLRHNNHPTVKPIALMEYLINMVTREGQTVLDPFAGSGTTLIAAKKLGRKYVGIELEPEYVKIAEARLNAVQERLIL